MSQDFANKNQQQIQTHLPIVPFWGWSEVWHCLIAVQSCTDCTQPQFENEHGSEQLLLEAFLNSEVTRERSKHRFQPVGNIAQRASHKYGSRSMLASLYLHKQGFIQDLGLPSFVSFWHMFGDVGRFVKCLALFKVCLKNLQVFLSNTSVFNS